MSTNSPTLEDRVAALEDTLAGIAGDNLQPSVLTVKPDGTIGADFTGTIKAEGITITGAGGAADSDNEIQWVDAGDGATLAIVVQDKIAVPRLGTFVNLELHALADSTDTGAAVLAYAEGPGGATRADVTVLNDQGQSSFLRLLVPAEQQLSIGDDVITWPGGAYNADDTVINHGLGRIPALILAQADGMSDGSGPAWTRAESATFTDTQATLNAKADHQPATGVTMNVTWLAIG